MAESVLVTNSSSNVNKESNFHIPSKVPFNRPKDGNASLNREGEIKTFALVNFRKMLFAERILKNAAYLIAGPRKQCLFTHYESTSRK